MALDGVFLRHTVYELRHEVSGARVSQIHQPSRDELVFSIHTRQGNRRLLLCARADSPRICLTEHKVENPASPPSFCMLLRKKLCGARLAEITQPGLDRTVCLEFDCTDELGDSVRLTVVCEIMGKHSNVILHDANGVIVDALRRVDMTVSSKRLVLPGLGYEPAPGQDKLSVLNFSADKLSQAVLDCGERRLDKAMLDTLQGVSPVVCRELAFAATGGTDTMIGDMTDGMKASLVSTLSGLGQTARSCTGLPIMLKDNSDKPFDFAFCTINQYGSAAQAQSFESFCALLDSYYSERDAIQRMRVRSHSLHTLVTNHIERLSRKLNMQKAELDKSLDRETLRIYGDLLQANLGKIVKGDTAALVQNFYDEALPVISITLDPSKTPAQNSQGYYRKYSKAKTADKVLRTQIESGTEQLAYLQSVLYEISGAQSEKELSAIRQELTDTGYLKPQKDKRKPDRELAFREFVTDDGLTVLVGRNNCQNDKLTLKFADKNDLWFHVKDMPGSHTILRTGGNREVSDSAILMAAMVCAYFSKARESGKAEVDYTLVRNVSKPSGAPPGRVIYVNHRTLVVKPELIPVAPDTDTSKKSG